MANLKDKKKLFNWKPDRTFVRYYVCCVIIIMAQLLLLIKLVSIQLYDSDFLTTQGNQRIIRTEDIPAHRGMIVDRNNKPLAVSSQVFSIVMNPNNFLNVNDKKILQLSKILAITIEKIITYAKRKNKQFIYLKRQVNPYVANQIRQLEISGIFIKQQDKRYYPAAEVASHLIGFTDVDGSGQEGIELFFNKYLAAANGEKKIIKSLNGRIIQEIDIVKKPIAGKKLTLSIDLQLQYLAYRELKQAVINSNAISGSAVVVSVPSGQILALVNQPSYNPNNRIHINFSNLRNRGILDSFEPGSTIKPLTIALALALGKVKPQTIISTSPGYLKIGKYTIRDFRNYGSLTVTDVLAKSSNVGMTKISQKLTSKQLLDYFDHLSFGRHTNIEFPSENEGYIMKHRNLSKIEKAAISYGYGLATTTLQLAKAYLILANDGQDTSITLLKQNKSLAPKQIIPPKVARQVREMLAQAVSKNGTGAKARIKNHMVGGKTGTVHINKKNTGYMYNKYRAIFAGIVPINKPKLVIVIIINAPQGNKYYGGEIAAPVFAKIAAQAMEML